MVNIFTIKNKVLLCTEDYYNKFSIERKVGSLAAGDLVQMTKMIFTKYGVLKKVISDAGTNFTSGMSRKFCRQMSMQQSITSSYHHQTNGQVKVCITFVKHTIKNALIIIKMLV